MLPHYVALVKRLWSLCMCVALSAPAMSCMASAQQCARSPEKDKTIGVFIAADLFTRHVYHEFQKLQARQLAQAQAGYPPYQDHHQVRCYSFATVCLGYTMHCSRSNPALSKSLATCIVHASIALTINPQHPCHVTKCNLLDVT